MKTALTYILNNIEKYFRYFPAAMCRVLLTQLNVTAQWKSYQSDKVEHNIIDQVTLQLKLYTNSLRTTNDGFQESEKNFFSLSRILLFSLHSRQLW